MKTKRILGISCIVVGAVMIFFSQYIAEQVALGNMRIASGQRMVDTANYATSQSQYTKPVGGLFTGSAQKKIDAGRVEASQYQSLANSLQIVGVILVVAGGGILFLGRKRG